MMASGIDASVSVQASAPPPASRTCQRSPERVSRRRCLKPGSALVIKALRDRALQDCLFCETGIDSIIRLLDVRTIAFHPGLNCSAHLPLTTGQQAVHLLPEARPLRTRRWGSSILCRERCESTCPATDL